MFWAVAVVAAGAVAYAPLRGGQTRDACLGQDFVLWS